MKNIKMLQYFKVTPILVFDGGYLPAKRHTESTRYKYFTFPASKKIVIDSDKKDQGQIIKNKHFCACNKD